MKTGQKLGQMKHGSFFVVLPKAVVEGMSWQKGDLLQCVIDGKDRLILKKQA